MKVSRQENIAFYFDCIASLVPKIEPHKLSLTLNSNRSILLQKIFIDPKWRKEEFGRVELGTEMGIFRSLDIVCV